MAFITGIILGIVMVIFALQNIATVTVSFFQWSFQGSVAVIMLLSLLVGMLISVLFAIPSSIRESLEKSRLKKENQDLKKDLAEHKVKLETVNKKIIDTEFGAGDIL